MLTTEETTRATIPRMSRVAAKCSNNLPTRDVACNQEAPTLPLHVG